MNFSRLKLLTFDVTDTLLQFKTPPAKQYGRVGALYGISCDTNSLATNFKQHWHRMQKEHPNYGLVSGIGWEQWWKEIIIGTFKDAKHNLDNKQLDALSSHLIHAYTTSTYWKHCRGALDLLSYLKHKGITLGVVSNFDPRLSKTLENAKLRHYFQFVITSYELGIEKPDPRIFVEAMKLSRVKDLKPDECLHVGDTATLDYKGAKNAGWNAALVHNKDHADIQSKHEFLHPDHVFATLFDLHKYLLDSSGEKLTFHSKY